MTATNRTPFRLAAIDIDGTLLGPDSQLSSANAAAIAQLQESGIRVILASGRRHENILRFHRLLRLEGPLVSCQGALVKNAETGEILHQDCISASLAAEVVLDGAAEEMTLIYYRADGIYISEQNALTDLYHSRGGDELFVADLIQNLNGHTPLKIIWMNTPACIAERHPDVEKRYRNRLDTLVTYPEYLEFIAQGVSKAVGISAVANYYGIDRSEVLAFGDGNNDVTMLEWAGMGVAMSVSSASAKAAANKIAPLGDAATSLARAVDEILG
jgi:Cof subfamily protein (haloacid dehalogenase superfamily)